MTNESARAYIALAIEVEEVRQEVTRVEKRLAQDPEDIDAAEELREGREMLERLDFATGVFMNLLKEKSHRPRSSLFDSADVA